MRRLWGWVVVASLVAIFSGIGWQWGKAAIHEGLGLRPAQSQITTTALRPQDWEATHVQGDRLLADVAALAFERFERGDRQTAQAYILQMLQATGWETRLQTFTNTDFANDAVEGVIAGTNILATRPGRDPTAGVVILGAHYDTVARSPGADDNATGVATVLEAARLLGSITTPRTLELVLFDQEETGLWGSQAFVNALEAEELRGGDRLAVILDMVGYRCTAPNCQSYPSALPITPPSDRGDFLAVLSDQPHPELAAAFLAATAPSLPPVFTLAIPLLGAITPDLLRSDHAPFWDRRIGAALVTDTANFRNPHYHQPSDTPTTLDTEFFEGSAQIVIHAILQLLTRPY